jgi:hypothetical protein
MKDDVCHFYDGAGSKNNDAVTSLLVAVLLL